MNWTGTLIAHPSVMRLDTIDNSQLDSVIGGEWGFGQVGRSGATDPISARMTQNYKLVGCANPYVLSPSADACVPESH
jgi:hypothetical protein